MPERRYPEDSHEDWLNLKALVNEALQDGPLVTDRDGYSRCWFCDGDGAWEREQVRHEHDCVWLRLEAEVNPEFDPKTALIDGQADG